MLPVRASSVDRTSSYDVQELHVAGVLLDEARGAARPGRPSASRTAGRRPSASSIVDLLQRARRRVHRGLAQLVGVHLAEALEALELDAPLGELEHLDAQLLERQRLRLVSPSLSWNGGVPASFTSSWCTRSSCRYSRDSNRPRGEPVRRAPARSCARSPSPRARRRRSADSTSVSKGSPFGAFLLELRDDLLDSRSGPGRGCPTPRGT